MSSTIEELTMDYTEEGILVTKTLDKVVLSKGAWSTILFEYQDWDAKLEDYGPIKFSIRRYQKREGEYRQRSKFNISSLEQAKKIVEALTNWMGKIPAESEGE